MSAAGKNIIFGPKCFADDDGHRVTVDSEPYIDKLRKGIITALMRTAFHMNTVVFQQDGAPPHYSTRPLDYLSQYFPGNRLISRRTDNPAFPNSPDLSPSDYFLWGQLKESVSGHPKHN